MDQQLKVGDVLVEIDPRYFRPLEVEFLQGDASKARKRLGWEPKVRFKDLVKLWSRPILKISKKCVNARMLSASFQITKT